LILDPTRVETIITSPVQELYMSNRTQFHRRLLLFEQPLGLHQRILYSKCTTSHQGRFWIFFIATIIFLHRTSTTYIVLPLPLVLAAIIFRSRKGSSLVAFCWRERWTFESVSIVTLFWFHFFSCFAWETHTAGERFRLQILHKSSIKRRRVRKRF
jgi:hypothetical protein